MIKENDMERVFREFTLKLFDAMYLKAITRSIKDGSDVPDFMNAFFELLDIKKKIEDIR